MTKLKAVVARLDDVPENLRDLYVEREGKFVLAVEGADDLPEIGALRRAHERVKAKLAGRAHDTEQGDTEQVDTTRLRELMRKHKDDPEVQAMAAELDAKERELAELPAKLDAKIARQDETIRRLTIDRAVWASLDAAGVKPAMRAAAAALHRGDCEITADGQVLVRTRYGRVPIGRHISRWANSEGAAFIDTARAPRASAPLMTAPKFGQEPVSSPAPAVSFGSLIAAFQAKK